MLQNKNDFIHGKSTSSSRKPLRILLDFAERNGLCSIFKAKRLLYQPFETEIGRVVHFPTNNGLF